MSIPLRHLNVSEIPIELMMNPSIRNSISRRKYSLPLLDHAIAICRKEGPTAAAKATGINIITLKKYFTALRKLAKARGETLPGVRPIAYPTRPSKYSDQLKQDVVREALEMRRRNPQFSQRKCFIEAGKRLGANGRSVEGQYTQGLLNPS